MSVTALVLAAANKTHKQPARSAPTLASPTASPPTGESPKASPAAVIPAPAPPPPPKDASPPARVVRVGSARDSRVPLRMFKKKSGPTGTLSAAGLQGGTKLSAAGLSGSLSGLSVAAKPMPKP